MCLLLLDILKRKLPRSKVFLRPAVIIIEGKDIKGTLNKYQNRILFN